MAFGPKYTGEGKLDFYSQNQFQDHENNKVEDNDFEMEAHQQQQPGKVDHIQRAKFVPVTNTNPNDLNSYHKKSLNTKQEKKPGHQKPQL
jgi:hypothetical protein